MGKLIDINDDSQVNKNEFRLAIPLKLWSNFWRSLEMSLINCEIELILTWSKNCLVLSNAKGNAIAATELTAANVSNVEAAVNVSATNATFKKTDIKLYVSTVTLSTENDKKRNLKELLHGINKGLNWLVRLKITT